MDLRRWGPALLSTVAVFVLVVVLLGTAASLPVTDPDVWWVAAAGRAMRALGHVPTQNMFSATEPNTPWVMHEWAFALPYAAGLERWGPRFFPVVAFAFAFGTVAFLSWATWVRSRHVAAGALACAAALFFFSMRLLTPRPGNLALVFPVAVACVAFAPRFTRWHAAACVVLEWLWANAHGSFPVGLGLMALAVLDKKEDRPIRTAALAFAAAATLANPYGLAVHGLFWDYLRSSNGVFAVIRDNLGEQRPLWRAANYLWTRGALGLVVFSLPLAVSAVLSRASRLRGLACLALVAMAVLKVRHIELAGLLSAMLLVDRLDAAVDRLLPAAEGFPRRALWATVLAAGFLAGVAGTLSSGKARAPLDWVGGRIGGPAAVRLAQALPGGAAVYAPFETSALVVWYANAHVLFDPRNDCYSADAAREGFALDAGRVEQAAIADLLSRRGVTRALTPEGHPVDAALRHAAGWKSEARDGAWTLYQRAMAP